MSQAPIDVKYDELLNWLLERYLIPKDWPKRLEAINVKKAEVLEEVYVKESPEFKKIQDTFKNVKAEMGYNEFTRLHQMLLKTEEAKHKTLFGSYTAPVMKNADLLINLYGKNNMHLCESSKLIIQNIGYEIPNCEKSNQYNERTINDYNSKISEKNAMVERNNEKLKGLFKTYAIKETDDEKQIATQLIEKLKDLPKRLIEIEDLIKNEKVKKVISGYHVFSKKLYNCDLEKMDPEFLVTLKEVNQNGDIVNITETQKYSFISQKVEGILEQLKSSENLETAIWNLKLTEGDGQIKSSSYLTNSKQRKKLINDLNELFIFCSTRLDQIIKEEALNLTMYQTNLRELNEELNNDFLNSTKKYLSGILDKLNNKDFVFLVSVFEDEKNLISIVNSFTNLKGDNSRLTSNIKDINGKIDEIRKEINEYNAKIQQFKKDSKMIKKVMEKFLTDNLKRKITIIGDINLI
jgi:hypothetical protein